MSGGRWQKHDRLGWKKGAGSIAMGGGNEHVGGGELDMAGGG